MDSLQLLIDLHIDGYRQGVGGTDATERAIGCSGLAGQSGLKIADIGCGTGGVTLDLARNLDADIVAVDILQPFLSRLDQRAKDAGLDGRIETLCASMDSLPFAPASLDAIWCEGAIYNMGFEKGVAYWTQFLKPGGILAVSELTWLTTQRPDEVEQYWQNAYAEVGLASTKIAQLEDEGYQLQGYFPLVHRHWIDNYYRPMQHRFDKILSKYRQTEDVVALVQHEREEIAFYERFAAYYTYSYYVARKI